MTDNSVGRMVIFSCGSCTKPAAQTGSKTKFVRGMRRRICGKCAAAMLASGNLTDRAGQKPKAETKPCNSERMADVTALVIKKPRTLRELSQITDYRENSIRRYLQALCSEGLVAVEMNGRANVWTWQ